MQNVLTCRCNFHKLLFHKIFKKLKLKIECLFQENSLVDIEKKKIFFNNLEKENLNSRHS